MIVALVPLFLVASIRVNENDWKYGPAVIYDVRVDSVAHHLDNMEKYITKNWTMKLNCRPKLDFFLSCKFQNNDGQGVQSTVTTSGTSENMRDPESFDKEIFELRFDADGIEDIIVSSSISPSNLDIIRSIVGQLNVGVDLSVIPMKEFETTEDSTAGTCKTKYFVTSRDANENDRMNNSYEIKILPGMMRFKEEVKEIQKIRNLDKCDYLIDYFFGSREGQRSRPSNIAIKIESSKSHMTISRKDFTSWTENKIIVSHNPGSTNISLTERITVSLDNIVPANGPLTEIRDSSSASIFPTTWLYDDNSSEESNDAD